MYKKLNGHLHYYNGNGSLFYSDSQFITGKLMFLEILRNIRMDFIKSWYTLHIF